jgi:hypothetical protein
MNSEIFNSDYDSAIEGGATPEQAFQFAQEMEWEREDAETIAQWSNPNYISG